MYKVHYAYPAATVYTAISLQFHIIPNNYKLYSLHITLCYYPMHFPRQNNPNSVHRMYQVNMLDNVPG